jgi:hypothetical protein
MAQYIKFRLTAAKVGVSMALAALIAGIAEKVHAAPPVINAKPAAVDYFLKLDGVTGESKNDFLKLELKYNKLNGLITGVERQLTKVYKKAVVNAEFLKIDTANSEFLKTDDASAEYLKIADASSEFLKIGGTAANSSELGGLAPDAFFQGDGNVVSGEASVTGSQKSQQLLSTPDGTLTVQLATNSDGAPYLNIHNGGSNSLPVVQDLGEANSEVGTTTSSSTIGPGNNQIQLGGQQANQLHLQIFPAGNFNEVVTITVSVVPTPSTGAYTAVGQMLLGNL